MNKISQKLPLRKTSKSNHWKHINNLHLADPEYNIPANVDILLGSDIWAEIVQPGLRLSRNGSPVATKTALGWILNGLIEQPANNQVFTNGQPNNDSFCFATLAETNDESIDE